MRILFIVYDNDSFISTFPLGIAYLASSIRKAGYEVTIYLQDVHHYSEEDLADYLDDTKFDVIGVGSNSRLLPIPEALKNLRNNK